MATVSLVAAVSCGGSDKTPTTPSGQTVDVFTVGNTFSPALQAIAVGTTVRFNITPGADGMGHNAIFQKTPPGAPADVNIIMSGVVSRQFTTRGNFKYDCTVHPGMSGEIDVQ